MSASNSADTATPTLTPFDPTTDAERYAELYNRRGGTPVTADNVRADYERDTTSGKPYRAVTARDGNPPGAGRPVGFCVTAHFTWESPDSRRLTLMVDPQLPYEAVAGPLYEDAMAWVAGQPDAVRVGSRVSEDAGDALAFFEARGFVRAYQTFASVLDVETFDETPFLPALERCVTSGLRLTSLAEIGDTEENRRRLFEINTVADRSEPAYDGTETPYEDFARTVFGAWWFRADGQFLAFDGETPVGIAAVGHNREHRTMFHAFTGTHPDYRGRGIAQALKLLTIRLAKQEGVARLRTNNDSRNAPMLAINRKFGYQPQPGHYQMERKVVG